VVGYSASGTVPLAETSTGLLILSPSGTNVSAATDRRNDTMGVIVEAAHEIGFYRVNEGAQHLGSIPVNIDPRESDLLSLSETQMRDLAATADRKVASAAAHSTRAIGDLLEGILIWPYLLIAALGLLGVEQLALLMLKR
jgi:hypothetical protein